MLKRKSHQKDITNIGETERETLRERKQEPLGQKGCVQNTAGGRSIVGPGH